jgi:hypothetical protein
MKKKYYMLITLLVFIHVLGNGKDLIKTGVYDFNEIINNMGDKPYLRNLMPEILMENLFLIKMVESDQAIFNHQSKGSSIEDNIEYYATKNYLDKLDDKLLKNADSVRKSGKMKNYLVSGIYSSRLYDGYNIILKPSSFILYYNRSILNMSIASSLSDYLQDKAKNKDSNSLEEQQETDETVTLSN